MASGPITSWQLDGKTVEIVADFILGAPESLQMVTADMKQKEAYFFKGKSLLFNRLSRLVITSLPRSRCLLFHGCSHHLQ